MLLGLALLASASAPFASAEGLFPCEKPSDCAAMGDLCDMAGMSSPDSCCQPSLAGDDSALPAVVKVTLRTPAGQVAHSLPIPAVLSAAPAGVLSLTPATSLSPPGSPPAVTVLRI